jgi:hypothetical protein
VSGRGDVIPAGDGHVSGDGDVCAGFHRALHGDLIVRALDRLGSIGAASSFIAAARASRLAEAERNYTPPDQQDACRAPESASVGESQECERANPVCDGILAAEQMGRLPDASRQPAWRRRRAGCRMHLARRVMSSASVRRWMAPMVSAEHRRMLS